MSDRASALSEHFCGTVNTTGKKLPLFAMRGLFSSHAGFPQKLYAFTALGVRLPAPGSLFSQMS